MSQLKRALLFQLGGLGLAAGVVTWLGRHYPDRKERVLGRLREARRGKLNDSTFGRRMRGEGAWADVFSRMFKLHRRRLGLTDHGMELSAAHFATGRPRQGELFE